MTGFRISLSQVKRKLAKIGGDVRAISFRPDVEKFATASLQAAVKLTPVRDVNLIEKNQVKQFHDRARFIRKNPGSSTRSVSQERFVKERAQARFLYRKSWKQCADSAKLRISVSAQVANSVTRRRNPVVQPPRGYAQWRGGGEALSLVIYNPFLEQKSDYKKFTGVDILKRATAMNQAKFKRDIDNRIRRAIYAASRS